METMLIAAIDRVPQLRGASLDSLEPVRLGGLTNVVYHVKKAGEDLVLRIPGKGTEAYIDRKVEAHNAAAAARAGVGAPVLFADDSDGLMLFRHVAGRTMSPALFQADDAAVERAGLALARMHRSGEAFRFRFELFAMIDDYLKVLAKLPITLPEGYAQLIADAEVIRDAMALDPEPLAPCHCDPLCENFLDDGQAMTIVDWEYSGMNEPSWDVGDLAVEAGLDDDQARLLLAAYLDREPTAGEHGRMVLNKASCDIIWTLWGLIQHGHDNPAEDFWAYSVNRMQRAQTLMASPLFDESLRAVRAG
ncbi:MAG: LPS biosynthesis choline kinase [Geminicoccaceae bacterium]|nr:MAG: LPS biosynthesis choline kinase [Geminicoccaceae bacterium]